MRIVFMGTPDFAVPSLKKLIDKHEVIAVFTQPDRPKGRGQKLQVSPVKALAMDYNIQVIQPERLRRDRDAIDALKNMAPDFIVVIAYGQILPKEVLDIPTRGCINVHASLLPELRGAAPINWCIIRGNKKTGITTMLMDEGLDTGDMLMKKELTILEDETAGELHDRMMNLGGDLLLETLKLMEAGEIKPEKQDDANSTYAPMMNKELGKIDWNKTAREVHNLVRGVTPWPGAYCYFKGSVLKVWKTKVVNDSVSGEPGKISEVSRNGIEVFCQRGKILITEVQEVGGKRLNIANYLNGHEINSGEIME